MVSLLNSDDEPPGGQNRRDQHASQCTIQETAHLLWIRMGENEIKMAVDARFKRQRTNCGREWAETRSTWLSLLISGDNIPTVGMNGRK